ncbi:hypothetical protein AGLY_000707 [Aphis glycines]|uniref:Uncharacterized protein n=1 Tax=Aphis glycines TaxID=307491 RepID=A0A6G0U7W2_APHGL|nr:hypothetical protein AGLY_000707 [Aphis glycines]
MLPGRGTMNTLILQKCMFTLKMLKKSRQVGTALLYIRELGGPRTRILEGKLMENLVFIYDLYFLNNNKYLKSFGINRCRYAISKTYGKLSVIILILSYEHKKFYDFSTSKLLANFRVFDRFPTIKTTHKEPCIKFSKLFGHPKIFYRHFKKNFSKKSKISVIPLTLTFGENFKVNSSKNDRE